MIAFVQATPEMVKAHCPGNLSSFAMAAVEGDEVRAVFGVYLQSTCQVVFTWISDELKRTPKMIVKGWRMLLKMMGTRNLPTLAHCNLSTPKADLMMLHFGFTPYQGDVWIYRGTR